MLLTVVPSFLSVLPLPTQAGTREDHTDPRCAGLCPVGTYCPAGSSEAVSCEKGQYTSNEGSFSCFDCSLGTYAPNQGASECSACGVGTFAAETGLSACSDCDTGGFCPDAGAASAAVYQQCPAGTYNPDQGSSSVAACKACATGKASPIPGSSDPNVCKECLPGSVAPSDGTSVCNLCEAGKFQGEKGKTACETCTLGCEQAAWRSNPDAFKAATDSLTRLALTKTSHASLAFAQTTALKAPRPRCRAREARTRMQILQ